ncbi:bla regulator protein blaR1 [Paenibacillus uliginis N3/975]|uniref:Bla regulator protein blaR1 n=1 Tax=Paenibacillus uliginis N3/975 TaxID=1313296 RepID=A0A1X7HDW2_9BACL|nr:M23/M56 family metallopeptidase [Paenibacillus uliginis]SMF84618.1 bla regulator protein blaR1 [Paenibacillus uliginis N3/975]
MDWNSVTFYLNQAFSWTLHNSIQACFLVFLILLCKQLGKERLPVRWHYAVWFLLIWKLVVPWSSDSSLSLFNWLPTPSLGSIQEAHLLTASGSFQPTEEAYPHNSIPHRDTYLSTEAGFSWFSVLSLIWIVGVIILAVTTIYTTYRFLSRVKDDSTVQDQTILRSLSQCKQQMGVTTPIPLRMSHRMTSPALMGIWRPQIWLPASILENLDEQELRHILLHELAHWKRRDIGVNSIISMLLIVNWFNPLLWYAASRMRQDQEMACDALVLTYLKETEVPLYGHTMIKMLELYAEPKKISITAGFSSSKKHVKRRIIMISRFKKRAYTWTASGIIVVLALGVFTLTDAQKVLGKELTFVTPVAGDIRSTPDQKGINIINNLNTPAKAAAAGKVLKAEYNTTLGNHVIIVHEDGYQTVYSHLEKLEVTAGATVTQGQLIGLLGSTGRSTGPHLNFQILKNGTPIDPMQFLVTETTKE